MPLNQPLATEFSRCTPSAPQPATYPSKQMVCRRRLAIVTLAKPII